NGYVAPYLTPPPSTEGPDPGMITNPQDFYAPPSAWVNINGGGGMPGGEAPQQRWGGQTSRDFGLNPAFRGGSALTDFGEKLREKPDLKMTPQSSEDGPRQSAGGNSGGGGRASSLPGAQATEDLHGNRSFFKGENLRSRLTIAPY